MAAIEFIPSSSEYQQLRGIDGLPTTTGGSDDLSDDSCMASSLLTPAASSYDGRRFSIGSSHWSADSFAHSFSSQSSFSSPGPPLTPVNPRSSSNAEELVLVHDGLPSDGHCINNSDGGDYVPYYDAATPFAAGMEGYLRPTAGSCSSVQANPPSCYGTNLLARDNFLSTSRDLSSAFEECLGRQPCGLPFESSYAILPDATAWPHPVESNVSTVFGRSIGQLRSPFEDDRTSNPLGYSWSSLNSSQSQQSDDSYHFVLPSQHYEEDDYFSGRRNLSEEHEAPSSASARTKLYPPTSPSSASKSTRGGSKIKAEAKSTEKRFPTYSQVHKAIDKGISSGKPVPGVTKPEGNGSASVRRKLRRSKIALPSVIDFEYVLPAGSKKASCPKCNKRFERREHMHRHEITVHSHLKRWRCWICDKGFNRGDNFGTHILTHTNPTTRQKKHFVEPEKMKREILERVAPERAAQLIKKIH